MSTIQEMLEQADALLDLDPAPGGAHTGIHILPNPEGTTRWRAQAGKYGAVAGTPEDACEDLLASMYQVLSNPPAAARMSAELEATRAARLTPAAAAAAASKRRHASADATLKG